MGRIVIVCIRVNHQLKIYDESRLSQNLKGKKTGWEYKASKRNFTSSDDVELTRTSGINK